MPGSYGSGDSESHGQVNPGSGALSPWRLWKVWRPLRKRQIRRDDESSQFRPISDHLKEELRPNVSQRNTAHLVEYDQVVSHPLGQHPLDTLDLLGFPNPFTSAEADFHRALKSKVCQYLFCFCTGVSTGT